MQPVLKALEQAQTQKTIQDQSEQISKTQQELLTSLETIKTLQNRVNEQQEYVKFMSEELRLAKETNDTLNQKVNQQGCQHLLTVWNAQKTATHERVTKIHETVEAIADRVFRGFESNVTAHERMCALEHHQQNQDETLRIFKESKASWDKDLGLYDALCEAQNAILIHNELIGRNINYGSDLLGTPERMRNLKNTLIEIKAALTKFVTTDFLTTDQLNRERIVSEFNSVQVTLIRAEQEFESLQKSKEFSDQFMRINEFADKELKPISGNELEGYRFSTTEAKDAVVSQLGEFAKADQERYIQLRQLMSEEWNQIVKKFTYLRCLVNIFNLTLLLRAPMTTQYDVVSKLAHEIREARKKNLPLAELKSKHVEFKARFYDILGRQADIIIEYEKQTNKKANHPLKRTLSELIKGEEEAQTQPPAELASSAINNATPGIEVEEQLKKFHSDLLKMLTEFETIIKKLKEDTDTKGNEAAEELMRFEMAIANNGVFTYQKTFYAMEQAAKVGLGPSLPPYRDYWNNPELGLQKMRNPAAI